jgi:hypothetical protein
VLLADCVYTASVQSADLVATGRLQGGKDANIAGLKFVRSVRGKTTQDDVVLKAGLQDLKRFVTAEAITN